ncbi:MAG: ribosome-associated translation inhibitor RaiA [Burkholderiaceae bacterium]|jgi:putative sigma-54 modulation protein
MNLTISGHHLDVTPAIREYVMNKLERVKRHFDRVIDVTVVLTVEKLRQKAEINLHLRGKDLHCEAIDTDLYAAIDMLVDKLDRQVVKHKECIQAHNVEPLKRQIAA